MENGIGVQDILALSPRVDSLEDVYRIQIDDGPCYLEIYENSDFGCEYALYDDSFNDIDSGVIDDYNAETEEAVAQLIFDLLEEMKVGGISIEKLSREEDDEENVDVFHERVEEAWREKVEHLKKTL